MSERSRAKEALRVEVNTYTGENVRKIAATAAAAEEDRILRVAAYCRVSTDDIDQLVSIEMQKNAYRDMIKSNPKWKHVGTYVDDGFSGTNTEHRPAFQLMMKDAMAGKIDMMVYTMDCSLPTMIRRSTDRVPVVIRLADSSTIFASVIEPSAICMVPTAPASIRAVVIALRAICAVPMVALAMFELVMVALAIFAPVTARSVILAVVIAAS